MSHVISLKPLALGVHNVIKGSVIDPQLFLIWVMIFLPAYTHQNCGYKQLVGLVITVNDGFHI